MPHPLDDLLAGEQVSGAGEQEFEQVVLFGIEGHLSLGSDARMGVAVEDQVAGAEAPSARAACPAAPAPTGDTGGGSPQARLDAGQQARRGRRAW